MGRQKRRPFTAEERAEVASLCFAGRLGRLPQDKVARCAELHGISPDEYGEIHRDARANADQTVNPLAVKK